MTVNQPNVPGSSDAAADREIERTWLLDRLPDLPPRARSVRIEQGYFPNQIESGVPELWQRGRLRRETGPNGRVHCTHTIKEGRGMVRRERERTISEKSFLQQWPRTQPRRITKTRYFVEQDELTWVVDNFENLDLVLAEVELPSPDHPVRIPAWLERHIVREVTDEKEYENYELALQLAENAHKT